VTINDTIYENLSATSAFSIATEKRTQKYNHLKIFRNTVNTQKNCKDKFSKIKNIFNPLEKQQNKWENRSPIWQFSTRIIALPIIYSKIVMLR